MEASWIALLPFLVVIPISILTKQVQPGLFVGLLLGSYLVEPSLLGGIKKMISYIVDNIVVSSNIRIIIFLYGFAGLIGMIKLGGGIKGFVHLVSKKVKSKKSAMFLTWISTIGTFSDPDFRIVTISPIMKALRKRLKMSKENIGFAIEATSNPVVGLVPIATAFVGYMVTTIGNALKEVGSDQEPYMVYVKSIPFNFFSFVIILIGIYYSFFRKAKDEVGENTGQTPNDEQGEEDLESCHRAYEKDTPIKPWNLILPLAVFLGFTIFLSWWDGHFKAKSFLDAFIRSDALGVMLESLMIAFLFTLVFFLFQRIKLAKLVTHFVKGGNELISVIILLALIWGVSAVSEDLHFSDYITAHVDWIPHMFVAPVLFLLGGLISYFIGSSWGTWGLLMPLGITMAHDAGVNILVVIGAVFASGTFGAFASPLSDNSVTLCTILDLDVIKYSKKKLLPACIAAGISTVLFAVASFIFR
ncbi:Na+/H+ antiporter NhaC family protein [Falsibacillus pallidus]|uniref:Transporter (NhaC family) n=1 Tax=Falsibacillus pallidus TaxID=493781 RepID=A0A370GFF6_9BACI|nr:Na+/H+ antiporter NhaC family protein [Falsibacillus pallidus]RDI41926.1 transporter (NhaC family) [Falsibacillus pallidus]